MFSTRIKNVQNKAFQLVNDIESNDVLTNVADRVMLLKYLSLMSQNKVDNFPYGKSKVVAQNKATDYVNTVFKEYMHLDTAFLDTVSNLKELSDSVKEPFPYDQSGWDHFIARVGYVTSISGKSEEDTKIAAIGIRLLEAEVDGKLEQALTSLMTLTFADPSVKELVDQLDVNARTNARASYSILTPFIDKYVAIADDFRRKAQDAELRNKDPYDFNIYASEAMTTVNMIKHVQNYGNINHRDQYRNTLLHRASYENDVNFAKALIECHIDLDAEHCHGVRTLAYALTNKQVEMVDLLLSSGAGIHFKLASGKSFIDAFSEAAEKTPEFKPLLDKYVPNVHLVNALTTVFGH